jgi:hypothetical protein
MGIRVGRMNYSDPLSFIAEGLFDGAQYFYYSSLGHFNAGAWYTGFLYKKNARITMTFDDLAAFNEPVDYGDFFSTYFAPKRVITALGWEHPSFYEFLHIDTAIVAQFDLSGNYHSQYLIAAASIPISNYRIEFGGAVELSQGNEFGLGFAGALGFYWLFPGEFNSLVSFTGKFTGGGSDNLISPFTPITDKYYGFILKHKMSGLSILNIDYSARINQEFGASGGISYFIRSDLGTFSGYPLGGVSEGHFLGPEIYGRLAWSPYSDLQVLFGGGAFFPALGNAGTESLRWRIELSASMVLF